MEHDNNAQMTSGERRENKRRKANKHPVHGRGLEAILNAERNRAAEVERRVQRRSGQA